MHKALLVVLTFLLFSPGSLFAATLSITPATGTYSVGETITVRVVVSSDVSVNAVAAGLSFSTDTLSLTSISKSSSFLNFWAQEPAFSNSTGTADFEGVSLGSGYTGANGTALSISFRAKNQGTGTISFRSGSILANDGQGTNVMTDMRGASFVIDVVEAETKTSEVPTISPRVVIVSSTHPDQAKWYKQTDAVFSWNLPPGALEVRTLLDAHPKSEPTRSFVPAISSRVVSDISDGTHYFHVKVRTAEGWSATSHFQINVDTTPPRRFRIAFPHGSTTFEPQPVIFFNTDDDISGIESYDVKVGAGGPQRTLASAETNPYTLPVMEPGDHFVSVTAFDRAGNFTTEEAAFTVEGIEPPNITSYPAQLKLGDLMRIRGTTYPNSTVDITVYEEDKLVLVESTKSNSLGDFGIILSKRLGPGEYYFTARAIDARGARSSETEHISFSVTLHLVNDVLAFVANYFFIVVIFLAAVGGIAAFGVWGMTRLVVLSKTLRKEVTEAESTVKKSFAILKSDLNKHIKRLHMARKNRPLTEDELLFLEDFEKDLEEAERIIRDEVDDIPKQ